MRVGNRSEPPPLDPRTCAVDCAEGDTFTDRVPDERKGEGSCEFTVAMEDMLDDGQPLANDVQLALVPEGRTGCIQRNDGSLSDFEPDEPLWWSRPLTGDPRRAVSNGHFRRAEAGQAQHVQTPAGAFDALPIESDGWWAENLAMDGLTQGEWNRTIWYASESGRPVAIEFRDFDALGWQLWRDRVALTRVHDHSSTTP